MHTCLWARAYTFCTCICKQHATCCVYAGLDKAYSGRLRVVKMGGGAFPRVHVSLGGFVWIGRCVVT
eukprot:10802270-Lingulodinium_polyedra.AAC.1